MCVCVCVCVCVLPCKIRKINATVFGCVQRGSQHLDRKRCMRRGNAFITLRRDQNNIARFNKLQLRLASLPTYYQVHPGHTFISSDSNMTDDGGFDPVEGTLRS